MNIESDEIYQFYDENQEINEKICDNGLSESNYSLYFKDISRYPLLSKEEERNAFIEYKIHGSEEAKEKLINSNLRLVVFIARKYLRRNQPLLSINDLIQEGNIGLIKAIEKYDLNKATRLSTYASQWIKGYIKSYADSRVKCVNLSFNMIELKDKFLKYQEMFLKKNFREPTDEEYIKDLNISMEKLILIKQSTLEIRSLEEIVEKFNFSDENADKIRCEEDFESDMVQKIAGEQFWKDISKLLNERELDIILRRYGKKLGNLGSNCIQTLKEIGELYNVSGSRISSIEQSAIKKLSKCKKLISYNK